MRSFFLAILSVLIPAISLAQKDSSPVLTTAQPTLIKSSKPLSALPHIEINKQPDTNKYTIRICAPNRGKLLQPLYIVFLSGKAIFRSDTSKTNPLAAINPQDIDKIDVLKNSAAVEKYGNAAKNGVVLITLKSGSPGINKIFNTGPGN